MKFGHCAGECGFVAVQAGAGWKAVKAVQPVCGTEGCLLLDLGTRMQFKPTHRNCACDLMSQCSDMCNCFEVFALERCNLVPSLRVAYCACSAG